MRIGIDAHAAEEDGSGNCTYIRNLLTALFALDHENEYFLYVRDADHPFIRAWEIPANFHIRRLRPKAPILRIPISLALASRRDRLDVLHVQYIAPPVHRGEIVATIMTWRFSISRRRSRVCSSGDPGFSSAGRGGGPRGSSPDPASPVTI